MYLSHRDRKEIKAWELERMLCWPHETFVNLGHIDIRALRHVSPEVVRSVRVTFTCFLGCCFFCIPDLDSLLHWPCRVTSILDTDFMRPTGREFDNHELHC